MTAPVLRRIGHYVVEREIGRGGMGIVYLGRDERLDRPVAIKVLPPVLSADRTRLARFEREAKLLALVNHPHIAAIYAIEEDGAGPYLILEYVPGESLADCLKRGPLPVREALHLCCQVAEGLEAAHERGVIHRDLKPANVRLTPEGTVKLLDFGLAKLLTEEGDTAIQTVSVPESLAGLTEVGIVVGTIGYMSPEQLTGGPVDRRTDVWSFGCLLFECLAGQKAWSRGETSERVQAVPTVPEWSALPPDTPERVGALLRRCLTRERSGRPRHVGELRGELESARDDLIAPERRPSSRPQRVGNLPRQLTSFVGRERERAEMARLLVDSPLLTVTGPGGNGKTRVALEVASDVQARFEHGAWFVDLVALAEPTFVPQAVASVLGIKEEPDRSMSNTLATHLRERSLLLVLDNCEHLIASCAELVGVLLRTCPELRVLATSREPLRAAGERIWALSPLKLEAGALLFAERAAAAVPGLTLNAADAVIAERICHRLDGLPLAIELAAARARTLSLAQIEDRLSDRFRLLVNGNRTSHVRHQTLRALLDWSYEQLGEGEQRVLRRLSVFTGGFTLEVAETVTSGTGIDEEEVLDILTHLVDRSLVSVERHSNEMRYRLLETIREYARQRLDEDVDGDRVRAGHLHAYRHIAEEAAQHLTGSDPWIWLDRLDAEHDNLRAALVWGSTTGSGGEDVLRLACALERFWEMRGHQRTGRAHLLAALSATETAGSTAIRAKALNAAGRLAWNDGDFGSSRSFHEKALSITRMIGDRGGVARSLGHLASVALDTADLGAAHDLYSNSLAIRLELGDLPGAAHMLHGLGITALRKGDFDAADHYLEQCLEQCGPQGDRVVQAWATTHMGLLALYRKDFVLARARLTEGLRLRRGVDSFREIESLEYLAYLELEEGHPSRAAGLLGAAERLREESHTRIAPVDRPEYDHYHARIFAMVGGEALRTAWAEGRSWTADKAINHALGTEAST